MTTFQPVNIFRAYNILISLPGEISQEDAISIIVEKFKLSERTAKTYLRALKVWGFLWGEETLYVKKTSLEEFILQLQRLFLADLGAFFEVLKTTIESLPASSVWSIVLTLRSKGFDVSAWKLKHIIRLLKQACLLWEKRFYEPLNLEVSLQNIIYARIISRGYYRLGKLLNELTRELNLSHCEIKKVLVQMILNQQILVNAPESLVRIWIKSLQSGYCDITELSLENANAEELNELKQLSTLYPDLISIRGDVLTVKIFDGNFIVVPYK
ncbi:MAG: hypothetical protein NDP13_02405 [Crenarchaeota archaeon]|nr:hypothetical protein [Thermoproteota archaeon]MCR8453823.1 hypothetical protein [Thermoproteota archaeon]MCR8462628.1 hypothetical protein [Thermoproteota archaeon]MCR8470937.1 hypothetical protein [Thermoproteota archaeon]MCR8471773.1 hypothetical protein [Thermoproteota archaeon]